MIPLPREACKAIRDPFHLRYDLSPLQRGLASSPYHVAVASMLLCRTRRVQVDRVVGRLFNEYGCPELLARATVLEDLLRPCGLHRNRSRQLQRFACAWLGDSWEDMRELPGVGLYVADAVGLFCFGCTKLESTDGVLDDYARTVARQT